ANESGQSVSFTLSGDTNPSLFAVAPSISPSGTLSYTPAAQTFGSATITVALQDDGGTANGGQDTSAPATLVINVTHVNQPPSFTKGADQNFSANAAPAVQNVPNWATNIQPGPANESSQTVNFIVTTNNNALFAARPTIDSAGTLSYQTVPLGN